MPQLTTRLCEDTRGAGLIEYVIAVGAIGLVAVVGYRLFGRALLAKAEQGAGCVVTLSECSRGGPSAAGPAAPTSGQAVVDATGTSAAGSFAGSTSTVRPPPGRMPGDDLPRSTADLVNRLWLDPRLPTGNAPWPWATGRTDLITHTIIGQTNRTQQVARLYGDQFSPADAANAEHFYIAATYSSTLPVAGPVVAAIVSIAYDGVVDPLYHAGLGVVGKASSRQVMRMVLNDWEQVYVDLQGVSWGAWKRKEPTLAGSQDDSQAYSGDADGRKPN